MDILAKVSGFSQTFAELEQQFIQGVVRKIAVISLKMHESVKFQGQRGSSAYTTTMLTAMIRIPGYHQRLEYREIIRPSIILFTGNLYRDPQLCAELDRKVQWRNFVAEGPCRHGEKHPHGFYFYDDERRIRLSIELR